MLLQRGPLYSFLLISVLSQRSIPLLLYLQLRTQTALCSHVDPDSAFEAMFGFKVYLSLGLETRAA